VPTSETNYKQVVLRGALIWNQPGSWAGDPAIGNSARTSVPYFVLSTGISPTQFWQIADSLQPVHVGSPSPSVPTVTLDTEEPLVDGQQIQVSLSGFRPTERVRLSECGSADEVSDFGCGPQLAQQPFVDTDLTGAGAISFVVHAVAYQKPYNTTLTARCANQCVIVAARGDGQPPGHTMLRFR